MKLTIHGPNLNDQSKGTFRVHAADCRDNRREVVYNGSDSPYTGEFATVEDVAELMYGDHIAEGSTDLDAAVADFYFAPCVKGLPNRVPQFTVAHTQDEDGADRYFIEDENCDWVGSPFDSQEACQMACTALNQGLIKPEEVN
jgi:hypothetical protein